MWEGHIGDFNTLKHRVNFFPAGPKAIHFPSFRAGSKARRLEKDEMNKLLSEKVIELAWFERPAPIAFAPTKDDSLSFCVE